MARKVTEWPSNRGPITKFRPSDGCKGDIVPLAVGQRYNFHEVGCHLGNVGLTHAAEIADGSRFAFGQNWKIFLDSLDEERIQQAEKSLQEMLDISSFEGKTFLDVGSGSGLFSLAAKKLRAQVHSFDFDPQSVGCTLELKRRYFPDDPTWVVEEGSVLDKDYLATLGQFDIVYSWGVLHHTGSMWVKIQPQNPSFRFTHRVSHINTPNPPVT